MYTLTTVTSATRVALGALRAALGDMVADERREPPPGYVFDTVQANAARERRILDAQAALRAALLAEIRGGRDG